MRNCTLTRLRRPLTHFRFVFSGVPAYAAVEVLTRHREKFARLHDGGQHYGYQEADYTYRMIDCLIDFMALQGVVDSLDVFGEGIPDGRVSTGDKKADIHIMLPLAGPDGEVERMSLSWGEDALVPSMASSPKKEHKDRHKVVQALVREVYRRVFPDFDDQDCTLVWGRLQHLVKTGVNGFALLMVNGAVRVDRIHFKVEMHPAVAAYTEEGAPKPWHDLVGVWTAKLHAEPALSVGFLKDDKDTRPMCVPPWAFILALIEEIKVCLLHDHYLPVALHYRTRPSASVAMLCEGTLAHADRR